MASPIKSRSLAPQPHLDPVQGTTPPVQVPSSRMPKHAQGSPVTSVHQARAGVTRASGGEAGSRSAGSGTASPPYSCSDNLTMRYYGRSTGMIVTAWFAGMFLPVFAQSTDIHTRISIEGVPSLGDPSARVILLEFSDYQCPLTGQHFNWTMAQIVDE